MAKLTKTEAKRLELDVIYRFCLNGDQVAALRASRLYQRILRNAEIGAWDGVEMMLKDLA